MACKKIITILASVCLLTTFILQKPLISSADIKKDTKFNIQEKISEISPLQNNSISVNNKSINLYVEFIDYELALDSFKEKYRNELDFIKQSLNLEELSIKNWEEYYNNVKGIEDLVSDLPNNIVENKHLILGFFDIFENSFKNIEAIEYYDMISKKRTEITTEDLERLSYLIPYTSEINTPEGKITSIKNEDLEEVQLKEGDKKELQEISRNYGINLTNAVNYASKHGPAGSKNSPAYTYFLGGDCTNFVSQVLAAGGTSHRSSLDPNIGWWFKRSNSDDIYNPYIYSHSYSWIRADTFARYWGVTYKTKSHSAFSGKIFAGKVIGFDESSDGDWDHLGFVTQADDYTANYGGKIYYDYKVAQHTSDYHAWTSTSTNGWETLEDKGYTYGLIGN